MSCLAVSGIRAAAAASAVVAAAITVEEEEVEEEPDAASGAVVAPVPAPVSGAVSPDSAASSTSLKSPW